MQTVFRAETNVLEGECDIAYGLTIDRNGAISR
jgi:hypothetical protein